jgi:D-alanine transaminase
MIVYLNGEFIPKEEACISPDDRGFLFADGAYEVLRSYGGRLFMTEDHLARLERSLQELLIGGVDIDGLGDVARGLIKKNALGGSEVEIYIQVTRGCAERNHPFPPAGTPPTVYAFAAESPLLRKEMETGVGIILLPDERRTRCDIKAVSLLPNVIAAQQARDAGALEAVFVREGVITEGASSNCCAVFDGELVTHPEGNLILSGITRRVVLELCRESGIPFRESPIPAETIGDADEVLVLSTRKEVMPVVRIDEMTVADGTPGPVTVGLQRTFREFVDRMCGIDT